MNPNWNKAPKEAQWYQPATGEFLAAWFYKELMLSTSGDEVEFKYEDSDEILLYVNSEYPAVLFRDDVLELISFLAHFIVGEEK